MQHVLGAPHACAVHMDAAGTMLVVMCAGANPVLVNCVGLVLVYGRWGSLVDMDLCGASHICLRSCCCFELDDLVLTAFLLQCSPTSRLLPWILASWSARSAPAKAENITGRDL
jgi:hypothetical protein